MYKRLRQKLVEFISSEDGKVGVKTSLSLGLVGGGILLMQTMFPSPAKAGFECFSNDECGDDEFCYFWCEEVGGVCYGNWHSKCVST